MAAGAEVLVDDEWKCRDAPAATTVQFNAMLHIICSSVQKGFLWLRFGDEHENLVFQFWISFEMEQRLRFSFQTVKCEFTKCPTVSLLLLHEATPQIIQQRLHCRLITDNQLLLQWGC